MTTSSDEYKATYAKLEEAAGYDFDVPKVIKAIEDILPHLDGGRLDDAHKNFFLTQALPRIVNKLKAHRSLTEPLLVQVHRLFQLVIAVIIKSMRDNLPALIELLSSILSLESPLYSARPMPEHYKYRPDPANITATRRNRRLVLAKPTELRRLRLVSDARHGKLSKAKQQLEDFEELNDRVFDIHPGVRRPSYQITESDSIIATQWEASSDSDTGESVEFDSDTTDSDTEEEFGAGVAPRREKTPSSHQALAQGEASANPYSISAYRVMMGADWVIDSVNFFGFNGGFTAMVEHLVSPKCSFPFAAILLQFWAHLLEEGLLVSARTQKFVMATELYFLPRIERMDAQDVRVSKKEDIESILKSMAGMFRSLGVSPKDMSRVLEPLYLHALKQFLLLGPIDKRVQALQNYISIVEAAQTHDQSMRMSSRVGMDDFDTHYPMGMHQRTGPVKFYSTTEIAQWIRDNSVVEGMFSAGRHAQVISKSLPLIRFLATTPVHMGDGSNSSFLRPTALEAIWTCATSTTETTVADDSFTLLTTISPLLHSMQLEHLVQSAAERLVSAPEARLVTFCAHISRVARDTSHRLRMLDALWTISILDAIDPDKSSLGATQLVESLKVDACARFRRAFLTRSVQHIQKKNFKSNSFAMKVAHGILNMSVASSSISDAPGSPRVESVSDLIQSLQADYNLIGMLVSEFSNWHELAGAVVSASAPGAVTSASVLEGRLPFQDELKVRLELLFLCLSHSGRIGAEFLPLITVVPTQIWEISIEKALFNEERNEVFFWFQCGRSPSSTGIQPVSIKVAKHLFDKMLQLDHTSENHATMSFLKCFQKYFLDVNAADARLTVLPLAAGAPPTEISVLAPPSDLAGISVFWTLAIDSSDAAVVDASVDFLLKLTEKAVVSPTTGLTKWSVRENYIQQCLRYLHDCVSQVVKSARFMTDLSRRRVLRCLKLLQSILDTVEPGINAEPTKTRSAPVSLRVKVMLDLPNVEPFRFNVDGDSNTPFKVIYQRVLISMQPELEKRGIDSSDLLLVDPTRPGITLDLHGDDEAFTLKSLEEIGLEDRQRITFRRGTSTKGRETSYRLRSNLSEMMNQKPPLDAPQKAQEVVEFSGLSTDMAMFALRKNRWDVHSTVDMLMDDSKRSALIAEARRSGVSEQTNSSVSPKSAVASLGLEEYLKVMAARTRLLLSASADESLTHSVDEAMQKHINLSLPEASMPSVILSKQSATFDLLFSVVSLDDPEVSPLAWKLVWRLPVPPSVKTGLLAGVNAAQVDDVVDWDSLLPGSSGKTHELHYALALIDQIVFPMDASQVVQKRVEWAHWFLSTGGGSRLLSLFLSSAPEVKAETALLLLKLSEFFWSSCLCSEEYDSQDEFTSFIRNITTPDLTLELTPDVCDKALEAITRFMANLSGDSNSRAVVYYALKMLHLVLSKCPTDAKQRINGKVSSLGSSLLRVLEFEQQNASLESYRIRSQAACQIADICSISASLRDFFLQRLLNMSEDSLVAVSTDRPVDAFFKLYSRLLKVLVKDFAHWRVQLTDLFSTLAKAVIRRPVVEHGAASVPDYTLSGILHLLSVLVKCWPTQVEADFGGVSFIAALLNDCLFAKKTSRFSFPKCKTIVTRQACFKLLRRLSVNSPSSHMVSIVKFLASQQAASYDPALNGTWDIAVADDERAASGFVGLANLGATCYANSLLQQWFMMKPFRADLLRAPVVLSGSKSFLTANSIEENIVYQLQRIFGFLQESEKAFYNPKEFCSSFRDLAGQPMNVSQQQDVNEFFNIVCQRIEEQLKSTPSSNILTKHFAGTVSNELRSVDPAFPYSSERTEEFYAVAVDIKHKRTLHDALDLFIKPERLDSDNRIFVEQYSRKLDAERISSLKKLSSTVIFHLKRFDYDVAYGRRNKLNDRFEFPMEINLKQWTREGVAQAQGRLDEAAAFQAEALKESGLSETEHYTFKLSGILIHSGSADSGHYYSIVRDGDKWLQFNDRVVSEFDPNLIPAEAFGGTQIQSRWDSVQKKSVRKEVPVERSAYMLFYERVSKPDVYAGGEIVEVPAQPEQFKSAAPSPADSSRVPVATNTAGVLDALLLAYKQSNPSLPALALGEESSGSGSAEQKDAVVPSASELVQGVPKAIFDAVWTDNSKFLRDRQLYDPVYFEFVLGLVDELERRLLSVPHPIPFDASATSTKAYISDDASAEDSIDMMLLKYSIRSLVEVVMRTKQVSSIPWWTATMRRIFSVHHVSAVWFVDYIRRNGIIRDALLVCPREKTRIEFADLCLGTMRVAARSRLSYRPSLPFRKPGVKDPVWEVSPMADDVCQSLILACWDLLDESRPHWKRFKQYFGLIRDCALLGRPYRELLIRSNIFVKYTDYFMGHGVYAGVSIMDDQNLPDLVEFIDTLNVLYRGSKTEAPADAPPSPYRLEDDLTEKLPPPSHFALFESKFFSVGLDMQYNYLAMTELMKHACWCSPDRSDAILEAALKTYQQGATHRLPGNEYQLAGLLSIQDSLQDKRVRRALTSFKFSGGNKGRGLIAHVMEMHTQNPKDSTSADVARFVLALCRDIPAVFKFVCRRQHDLEWLKDFLEHKLDEVLRHKFPNFRLTEDIIAQDANANNQSLFSKIVGYIPSVSSSSGKEHSSALEFLRQDPTYAAMVFVTWCLQHAEEGSMQGGPADDLVFKLQDQVQKLQQQLRLVETDRTHLVEALRWSMENGTRLPGDMFTKVSALVGPLKSPPASQQPGNSGTQALVLHPGATNGPNAPAWTNPNLGNLNLTNTVDPALSNAAALAAAAAGVGHPSRAPSAPDPDVELDDMNLNRSGHRARDSDEETEPGLDGDDWASDRAERFNRYGPDLPGGGDFWRGGGQWTSPRDDPPPTNLSERIESLRGIFGDAYDNSVLTEALRSNRWDLEATAEAMFDSSRVDRYIADAKRRKENVVPQVGNGNLRLNVSDDDIGK